MKQLIALIVLLPMLQFNSSVEAQNPFITHIYSADPSGHVWKNDTSTLWIYASHDVPETNHHATMFDYHVFSTKDLVNWTDYGRVLSVDDVDWATDYAWAIDAILWQHKYYLIFCMHEKGTGMFRTGIAVSNVPQGPFKNLGYIKGIEWGQDPAVFQDDDNKVYIYWGAGGSCFAAELNDDLLSIKPESKVDLSKQLTNVYEGPWVHKYKGKYYLSYPGLNNGNWPEEMYYAIAEKPLGPYTFKGKYIPEFKGQAGTNHGSIVKFNGKWIALHHSAILSDGKSEVRCLMGDYLYYNTDGTIKTIVPDPAGLSQGKPTTCTVFLEAEDAPGAGGKLMETKFSNEVPGFSGTGYVTNFLNHYNYLQVLVQVAKNMKATLIIRLAADADFSADILVGALMRDGWNGTKIKKTNGWEEINLGEVELKEGDNIIRINSHQNVNLKVDYFKLIMP
jgi:Beta-xylosidase